MSISKPANRVDAFVYVWKNIVNGKRYIGSHKGTTNDGYEHTSSNTIFLEEFSQNRDLFVRQIFAFGTYQQMRAWELKLCERLDAAKHPNFYNKNNGTGKFYCDGHSELTRKKMQNTWKNKKEYNCDHDKAIAAWQGSKHKEISKKKMKLAQSKYTTQRSSYLKANNPMKNPASIAKMVETRRRNRNVYITAC